MRGQGGETPQGFAVTTVQDEGEVVLGRVKGTDDECAIFKAAFGAGGTCTRPYRLRFCVVFPSKQAQCSREGEPQDALAPCYCLGRAIFY